MSEGPRTQKFRLKQVAFEDRLLYMGAWVEWSRLQVLAQFQGLTPDQRDEWQAFFEKMNRIHNDVFGLPAYTDADALQKLWRE